ncbi:MAG: Transcriptional regulator lacI family protein [Puniceicoccaceae bacterium 5H]|nr:MAG: Transcriptional regulator lacI family protein [Puniceicoccaceae bacterium 5H]
MKDVAQRAGVHQTTVSLALRGHPSIPECTRERIRNIADQMGYRPDPSLRALHVYRRQIKGSTSEQTLAYITNLRNDQNLRDSHVHAQLAKSARERAEELGYKLETFWYGRDYQTSQSLDRVLKARGIRGVILGAFVVLRTDLDLDWNAYCGVKIDLLPIELCLDAILSNQMFAVRMAMRHLRESGLRRMGLAVAQHDELHNRNLFTAGYMIGQRHLDPDDRIPPLVFDTHEPGRIYEQIHDWAQRYRPDAIMSNWNSLDRIAWQYGRERGQPCRFVPLDANERTRRYGGIDQNHVEVARRAVDLVESQMSTFRHGIPKSPGMTLVDPIWIPFRPISLDDPPPIAQSEFIPGHGHHVMA